MAINNIKRYKTNSINNKNNQNKIQSGGLNFLGLGGMTGAIRRTKRSELQLINAYEEYENRTRRYNKAYQEHLENLKKMDDYGNFKGLETLFSKHIIPDELKGDKVDKTNPLLFRNYPINAEVPPSELRKEHIKQQIEYILEKNFAERDRMLIKYYEVELGKSEFILNITTIDNVKKSRKISHDNYIISMSETRSNIKDILTITKKNLKRSSLVVDIGNKSSTSGSKKTSSKKSASNKSRLNTVKNSGFGNVKGDIANMFNFGAKKSKKVSTLKVPTQKRKNVSMFTPFISNEKKKEAEEKARAIEQAKQMAIQQRQAIPQMGPQIGPQMAPNVPMLNFGEKKEGLLQGQPIAQPLGQGQEQLQPGQFGQQSNADNCKIHTDFVSCRNAGCWFDKATNTCGVKPQQLQQQRFDKPRPPFVPPQAANPFI